MSKLIFNPKRDMKELEKYGLTPRYNEYTGQVKMFTTLGNSLTRIYYVDNDHNREPYWEFISNDVLLTYKLTKANLIIDEEKLNETNRTTNN